MIKYNDFENVTDEVIVFTNDLLNKLNKIPNRITDTVEQGLCLVFKNNTKVLYLEIYNDGEKGYIIEDFKEKIILKNEVVFTSYEIVSVINEFMNL